jgi:nitrate/nitrite-specific signal transduction histidine kinase
VRAVGYGRSVSLRQLKLMTIVAPLVFLLVVDFGRRLINPEWLPAWVGEVLVIGIVLAAVLGFSATVFGRVEQMQASLERQNRELLALHEAGLDVAGELSLEVVLQKVVDHASSLIGARYGALSVPDPERGIDALITSGLSPEERALIGPEPKGHGLLGVVTKQGAPLRLADIGSDPRSVGVPEGHPAMRSLLAVPIVSGGRVLGNLYLAEKIGATEFSAEDEDTLRRFATQAALAIENARLHLRVRDLAITEERERIAREMHDSLAQVLGYVMTKAQAVQELLKRDQTDKASAQVAQLNDAARGAYADVREGILALRTSVGSERGLLEALQEFLERWKEQSGVHAELHVCPEGERLESLSPVAELQLLRIVQEALANVRKHAQATHAEVRITAEPHAIETVIADDGRGFDPESPSRDGAELMPRFGLATMRERAESVSGTLRIESAPGGGTRVVVRLPA